ncbi:MAG: DUF4860 domain-containing protein [Oscillospiraceae bacterium]|nr:DUF4860 domain-containing protein [Oscillospiraceae bacterium]
MKKSGTADIIFTLLLFCVFTVSVLMVLLSGAGVYKGIVAAMDGSYEERTCLQYIGSKIRHYSGEGTVNVANIDGIDALIMTENIEGDDYNTYIYLHEGKVKELFTSGDLDFYPEDGFDILDAQRLVFERAANNLLRIECMGSGGRNSVIFAGLRGVEGGEA